MLIMEVRLTSGDYSMAKTDSIL